MDYGAIKRRAICSAIPADHVVGTQTFGTKAGVKIVYFYSPIFHNQAEIVRLIAEKEKFAVCFQPFSGPISDKIHHYPHLSLEQLSWTLMNLRLKPKISNNTKFVYFQSQNILRLEQPHNFETLNLMKKSDPEMVGARLRTLRRLKNVPQTELCKALEIAPQRYNHYEKGRARPDPDVLQKFMQYYAVTSDYLLYGNMIGLRFEIAQQLIEAGDDGGVAQNSS